ncbi:hypothetical protein [Saccharomonospora sp. CUA-673]|uniref:hypothetical protein n=1 Tax=Saccharomonospora sp. CUA-673 TaxID=1904969 RepID=UPI0013012175|nr:hypothetical protein [Saccharomonospora sp. CUA-673]
MLIALLIALWILASRTKARRQNVEQGIEYVRKRLDGWTTPNVRLFEAWPLTDVQIIEVARKEGYSYRGEGGEGFGYTSLDFVKDNPHV